MNKVGSMNAALLIIIFLSPLAEACPHGCICPSYRKVVCYNASLTSVPQDLYNEDIITLDLSHNAIGGLWRDCFKTHRLRYLFLHDNRITRIHRTAFWNLGDLQNLFLNNNNIGDIDPLTFLYNGNLKELDLSFNELTSLDASTFVYNPSLTVLNLSGNKLTSLNFIVSIVVHEQVSKDLTLLVANNSLKYAEKEILRSLGRLKNFDISNNELMCPCRRRHHLCQEYTTNWKEYEILCLQNDDLAVLSQYPMKAPSSTSVESISTAATKTRETMATSTSTPKRMKTVNTERIAVGGVTPTSLSKLEITIIIVTLSLTLVVLLAVTVAYFILRSRLQNQENQPPETVEDLKDKDDTSDERMTYAEVDEGLDKTLLPFRVHLVTPVELNEPLYQVESVGSFIYTPPSEVYFDPKDNDPATRARTSFRRVFSYSPNGGRHSRQPMPNVLYCVDNQHQRRVPLERGFSIDGRSVYDYGIYNYDHIYEEIK